MSTEETRDLDDSGKDHLPLGWRTLESSETLQKTPSRNRPSCGEYRGAAGSALEKRR